MGTRDRLLDETGAPILTEEGEYIILEAVTKGGTSKRRYNFWMKYQLFYSKRRMDEYRRRRKR